MLSIVIPTLNEEKYLPMLLRSLQAQSYKDFEIIVSDNFSTDGTRAIAEEYGAKVIDGDVPGPARNLGAAEAKGDIILFLDADVILPDPWYLQMTVAEFEKRGLDVATCKIDPLSDKKIDKLFHDVYNYFMWVTEEIKPHAPGFCIFVRKRIHDEIGGFDEAIKLAEDHDYVDRAGKVGKFGLLKSYKIPVSVRRFDRDGRLNIAMKFILAELYMRTKGNVTSDIFNYTFGHDESAPKKVKGRKRAIAKKKLTEMRDKVVKRKKK